jgi:hypothetical protein
MFSKCLKFVLNEFPDEERVSELEIKTYSNLKNIDK